MTGRFSKIFGNDATKARLGDAVKNSTLPHAFLFIGDDGSGKKTLALELSAAINCENRENDNFHLPCHVCNTCRRITEGNYTDIKMLKRNSDKATVGVDEVRLFREDMFLSATESDHRIYIIEEADRLTVNAQNALLTVLEEPPSNVVIILLARSADNILSTVKSRAESIFLERFNEEKMTEYLTENSESARAFLKSAPEMLSGIIMSSDGRIGKALSLLSGKEAEENKETRELTENIVKALMQNTPYSELYAALSKLPSSRTEFTEALEFVMSAVRDIIVTKLDKKAPLSFYISEKDAEDVAKSASLKRMLSIYDIFTDTLEDASKNVGISALTANLGARIKLI